MQKKDLRDIYPQQEIKNQKLSLVQKMKEVSQRIKAENKIILS